QVSEWFGPTAYHPVYSDWPVIGACSCIHLNPHCDHILLASTVLLQSMCSKNNVWSAGTSGACCGGSKNCQNAKILVSNHVSPLDHCVIDQVRPNIQPDYWDMHSVWKWIFGYKDMGVSKGHDVFEENIKKHCAESDIPLLFHPERTTTSGRVGLLKFSTFPFELGQPVQPISIRVSRYIFHISLTTIHSDWWSDLFWCLFVPFTVYQLRFLPVEEKQDGEDAEDFAKRVQKRIAKPLKLWRTDFTYTEKAEFVKRLKPPRKIIQNSVASNNPSEKTVNKQELDPEFLKMIKQVKGVLPHIPDSAIEKDLILMTPKACKFAFNDLGIDD
ncbi:hypothetical protein ScPMuIL_000187, partial [Solemya velum]